MPKAASGEKKSRRAAKDKNAPKRPLSAYMFFSKDYRERVKTENADATFGQIGKILGEMWRSMGDDQKAPYDKKAKEDKARYEREKNALKA
ncbi:Non-histone chromosomal protein 6 [Mycoemilia scoparia]|uniref:Non-histone chromosomal protein 6 n=1 Tax=Mycoemilia scoparia TaxID=417184 RepID=A0A9W8A5C1_9FUNG|nr:Non-histone chromosomal protein 6 [Mycoemilia scoparia]